MKKPVILLLVFIFCLVSFSSSSAQQRRDSVFVEVMGSGLMASIHYEHLFTENLGLNAGVGGYCAIMAGGISLPVTVTYLIGEGNHKLELGAGAVYASIDADFLDEDEDPIFNLDDDTLLGTGFLGYRYVSDAGFLFRAGFTPFFYDGNFIPYGGLSLGYSF